MGKVRHRILPDSSTSHFFLSYSNHFLLCDFLGDRMHWFSGKYSVANEGCDEINCCQNVGLRPVVIKFEDVLISYFEKTLNKLLLQWLLKNDLFGRKTSVWESSVLEFSCLLIECIHNYEIVNSIYVWLRVFFCKFVKKFLTQLWLIIYPFSVLFISNYFWSIRKPVLAETHVTVHSKAREIEHSGCRVACHRLRNNRIEMSVFESWATTRLLKIL